MNDGVFTCFIPWIKETRKTLDSKFFDPIPDEQDAIDYFFGLLREDHPDAQPIGDGWEWRDGGTRI